MKQYKNGREVAGPWKSPDSMQIKKACNGAGLNGWDAKKAVSDQTKDQVNAPNHYKHFPLEVKVMIKLILEASGLGPYASYCLGNEIKYRLRAGFKDVGKIIEDIEKSLKYEEMRNE